MKAVKHSIEFGKENKVLGQAITILEHNLVSHMGSQGMETHPERPVALVMRTSMKFTQTPSGQGLKKIFFRMLEKKNIFRGIHFIFKSYAQIRNFHDYANWSMLAQLFLHIEQRKTYLFISSNDFFIIW